MGIVPENRVERDGEGAGDETLDEDEDEDEELDGSENEDDDVDEDEDQRLGLIKEEENEDIGGSNHQSIPTLKISIPSSSQFPSLGKNNSSHPRLALEVSSLSRIANEYRQLTYLLEKARAEGCELVVGPAAQEENGTEIQKVSQGDDSMGYVRQ